MRIGIVLDRAFPPDERVENRAASLRGDGHRVHVLCAGQEVASREHTYFGAHIHPMSPPRERWLERLNTLIFKTTFTDPLWLLHIVSVSRVHGVEALQVLDLPLARTAIAAGRVLKVPVIFDMLEQWPQKMRIWSATQAMSLSERLSTHSYRRLKRLERYCLSASHHIVCPAYFDLDYILGAGVSREKITVVPNYVDTALFNPEVHLQGTLRPSAEPDDWVILFVGTMGYHRGLHTLVRAMPYVTEQIAKATLLMAGRSANPHFLPWLKGVIRRTHTEKAVSLLGWVDYRRIPHLFAGCDVSVVPFCAGVPGGFDSIHKIFQSMAMGKPVVVSDIADFRENIEALQCGVVVPPDDPLALAEALVRLHDNSRLAHTLGRNGREAVLRHYNWQTGGQRLVRLYRSLEGDCRAPSNGSESTSPTNAKPFKANSPSSYPGADKGSRACSR